MKHGNYILIKCNYHLLVVHTHMLYNAHKHFQTHIYMSKDTQYTSTTIHTHTHTHTHTQPQNTVIVFISSI